MLKVIILLIVSIITLFIFCSLRLAKDTDENNLN